MASIIILAPVGGASNGADIAMNHQMTHLRSLGHEVTLVTRVEHAPGFAGFLAEHGIASRVLDYGWWSDLDDDGMARRAAETVGALATMLAETTFDVAITNTVHMPWLALAAAGAGVPHLWLIHEFPSGEFAATRAVYPFVGAYSTEVLAASAPLAREVSMLVPGTPVSHFLPFSDRPVIGAGVPDDAAPRLVSVNHVSARKNTLELVEVFEAAQRRVPGMTLEIRGGVNEPAYHDEVRALIAERGIEGVRFETRPDANWAGVRPSDVVVHTSHLETFALTLVETLKAGLVTVAAANPATDAMVDLGYLDGGDVYPAGDVEAAAELIAAKVTAPAAARAHATKVQARALTELTLAEVTRPLVDAIDRAITDAPSKARQPELRHLNALFRGIAGVAVERDAWARRARTAEAAHAELITSRTWRATQAVLRPVRALRRRAVPRG